MNKRTKALQFNNETAQKVIDRDSESCLFCRLGYRIAKKNLSSLEFNVFDVAHFIPKSHGGLGIEENLVLLCRQHHYYLDFSNSKTERKEMLSIMEEYLKSQYPNWNKDDIVYKKGIDL